MISNCPEFSAVSTYVYIVANYKKMTALYGFGRELIDKKSFTQAEIDAMREKITEKMLELLGPFEYLLIDIPLLSYIEDKAGDLVLGEAADDIQEFARELELPESFFEEFCETP